MERTGGAHAFIPGVDGSGLQHSRKYRKLAARVALPPRNNTTFSGLGMSKNGLSESARCKE